MVDVIITGESGKLHAVYHKSEQESAPLAVVLSGSPRQKCHMNDRISYAMFRAFMDIGFSVVRFNYRGVNDSEGAIGTTADNMLDIATVVDWIQNKNEDSEKIWLAGHQLGAWYVLQMLMRRPEISGFALVSPDVSVSDFGFLSPRPNRGLLLQGSGAVCHNAEGVVAGFAQSSDFIIGGCHIGSYFSSAIIDSIGNARVVIVSPA